MCDSSFTCHRGEQCLVDEVEKIPKCIYSYSPSIDLEIVFIRHGYSCANAVKHELGFVSQYRRVFQPDPALSPIAIKQIKGIDKTKIPQNLDMIMCSTMLRAQQTALYLFPGEKINIIPYVKEIDFFYKLFNKIPLIDLLSLTTGENTISETPNKQFNKHLPEHRKYLNYGLVAASGDYWQSIAHETSYIRFLELMKALVMKFQGKTPLKFAVVTHSNFIKSIFKTRSKESIRNVGMVRRIFKINQDHIYRSPLSQSIVDWSKESEDVPFIGFDKPKKDVVSGICTDY